MEDIDLGSGTLKVVAGKGDKTARVNLSSTLVEALEHVPLEKRRGYLLPARSRIAVYKRLEAACRVAKVKFKGFMRYDMLRGQDSGMKPETWRWWSATYATRASIPPGATRKPATSSLKGPSGSSEGSGATYSSDGVFDWR